jgi:hypothetical protein
MAAPGVNVRYIQTTGKSYKVRRVSGQMSSVNVSAAEIFEASMAGAVAH